MNNPGLVSNNELDGEGGSQVTQCWHERFVISGVNLPSKSERRRTNE